MSKDSKGSIETYLAVFQHSICETFICKKEQNDVCKTKKINSNIDCFQIIKNL